MGNRMCFQSFSHFMICSPLGYRGGREDPLVEAINFIWMDSKTVWYDDDGWTSGAN